MATQAIESVPSGDAAGSSTAAEHQRRPGSATVLILAIAGLAGRRGGGSVRHRTLLAKRKTAAVATHKTEGKLAEAAVVHSIENLVLNPAGSGGTRFLMVTATFELKDGSVEQQMKDHEAEVRDHILALLGKKTVEELTDISAARADQEGSARRRGPAVPEGRVQSLLPQFVIQ